MRLSGLRKHFKFDVVRCITEGVIGRKPQSGNFRKNFRGRWCKNYGSDPKKLAGCKNGMDVLYEQSLVEIGGHTATEDEERWCFCLYVCMFVTLDVQERGPDIQQRIMSLFVGQFQCGFHFFYRKKRAFQLYAEI